MESRTVWTLFSAYASPTPCISQLDDHFIDHVQGGSLGSQDHFSRLNWNEHNTGVICGFPAQGVENHAFLLIGYDVIWPLCDVIRLSCYISLILVRRHTNLVWCHSGHCMRSPRYSCEVSVTLVQVALALVWDHSDPHVRSLLSKCEVTLYEIKNVSLRINICTNSYQGANLVKFYLVPFRHKVSAKFRHNETQGVCGKTISFCNEKMKKLYFFKTLLESAHHVS